MANGDKKKDPKEIEQEKADAAAEELKKEIEKKE